MPIEIPFFGGVSEYVFYLFVSIILLLVFIILVWFRVRKMPKSSKGKEKGYTKLSKLSEKKAKLNSKLALIEDARGRLAESEYNEQKQKIQKEIDGLNKDINKEINKLAEDYFYKGASEEEAGIMGKLQARNQELEREVEEHRQRTAQLTENMMRASNERDKLKTLISETKEEVTPFEKGRVQELEDEIGDLEEKIESYKEKMDEYYHKSQLYELLVNRYLDYIEEKEEKNVQDIKDAVQPNNSYVDDIVDEIKAMFPRYDHSSLFRACEIAYEKVLEEIHSVPSLNIDFWMSIEDMIENGVADYEDKAILLCSIFRALGSESSVIIAELSDGSNRPFVLVKPNTSYILCDPNSRHDFRKYIGVKDRIIDNYRHGDDNIARILYEFNDKEYKEF